jgi:predicted protein tyrosine phosphatase
MPRARVAAKEARVAAKEARVAATGAATPRTETASASVMIKQEVMVTATTPTESQRATLSELARDHTEEAVAALVDVMRRGISKSARIAAANAVLDRGYGKAAAYLDLDSISSDGTMTPKVCELTDEELKARIKHFQDVINAGEARA